eukprot:Gb_02653 [translate_table: standard]
MQGLGYGWAGLFRIYVVEPAHMWWSNRVAQVSLLRALHEKDEGKGISRGKFFLIVLICSFSYYVLLEFSRWVIPLGNCKFAENFPHEGHVFQLFKAHLSVTAWHEGQSAFHLSMHMER